MAQTVSRPTMMRYGPARASFWTRQGRRPARRRSPTMGGATPRRKTARGVGHRGTASLTSRCCFTLATPSLVGRRCCCPGARMPPSPLHLLRATPFALASPSRLAAQASRRQSTRSSTRAGRATPHERGAVGAVPSLQQPVSILQLCEDGASAGWRPCVRAVGLAGGAAPGQP
jgi:hypothetical protein